MFITLAGCGKKAKDSVSSEYIGYEEGMLRIEMTNRTKEDVIYGYPYALYKKQENGWVYLTKERAFLAIAMELPAGESFMLEMEFKDQDRLSAGEYRFEKDYETADGETHTSELEFTIQ